MKLRQWRILWYSCHNINILDIGVSFVRNSSTKTQFFKKKKKNSLKYNHISLLLKGEEFSTSIAVELTLKDALEKYQKDINGDRCKIIDVDRGLLWKTALMF